MSEQPLIDSRHEQILSLPDETQFAPNGIVSRTLLRTANSHTVLFGFAEGQELTEHTSTQHALIQVLSGECEFSLAGKLRQLKAGNLLYMPPNLPHAVKATRQFSMLLTLFKPEPVGDLQPISETHSTLNSQSSTSASRSLLKSAATEIREVDARGLEPPQPLVRILEALTALPGRAELRARTDRQPMHLYAQLEARGFVGETEEQSDGSFITHIRRA